MGDLVGERVYNEHGTTFPLLVKFLDANQDLSIQVHPDNNLAAERHDCYGKTEFWYVLEAESDAKLLSGFSKPTDKETYLKHLHEGTLDEIVKWHPAQKGDVFFIPSGRIHALGKGNMVLEVQQTSDITYRIYDYNRQDADGKLRELHTEQALDAINFECLPEAKTRFEHEKNKLNSVIECDFFAVNYIKFDKIIVRDYYQLDSFVIYVCLSGQCTIQYPNGEENLTKGETVLIPAELDEIKLLPTELTEIMEIYINQ
jgi:mannose-6-phosphate isomerase